MEDGEEGEIAAPTPLPPATPPPAAGRKRPRPEVDLRKTSLCKAFAKGGCGDGDGCRYAHGRSELRARPAGVKLQMCKAGAKCRFGKKCRFAHAESELSRQPKQPAPVAAPVVAPAAPVDSAVLQWVSSLGGGAEAVAAGDLGLRPEPAAASSAAAAAPRRGKKTARRLEKDKQWRERQERELSVSRNSRQLGGSGVCSFFLQSRCTKGSDCPFSHDAGDAARPAAALCKFFLGGSCRHGERCVFSHDTAKEACRFLFTAGTCKDGDRCRFSHAAITEWQLARLRDRLTEIAPSEVASLPASASPAPSPAAPPSADYSTTVEALLRPASETSAADQLAQLLEVG